MLALSVMRKAMTTGGREGAGAARSVGRINPTIIEG